MESNKIRKKEPFVSIIIINFNGGDIVHECIRSIYETVMNRFEIILIDNKSSDNSSEKCKKKWPEIKLIQNEKNIGLTARNIGIKESKGEFIVFLDSDTVVTNGWLKNLIQSFKENGDGLYQPKLLEKNRPDVINSAGNMINILGMGFSRGKGEKDEGQYEKFQEIGYTSGACTFTSTEIIKKIGNINNIFFSYHDDLDYGWRGWLQKIPSYYEPKSKVYHLGSPTLKWSAKKFYFLERNRWICLLYLYSTSTILKIFPILVILEIGIFFYFLKKGYGKEKFRAFLSLFKLRKQIKESRKKVEKLKDISDKEVIEHFVNNFELPLNLVQSTSNITNKVIEFLSKLSRTLIKI
jgi:GT2 family glycosyltransferase